MKNKKGIPMRNMHDLDKVMRPEVKPWMQDDGEDAKTAKYIAEDEAMRDKPQHMPVAADELMFKKGYNDGQIYGIDGKTLAVIPGNNDAGYLFAAAPELLEAAKDALSEIEIIERTFGINVTATKDKLHKAVAKAEGRE